MSHTTGTVVRSGLPVLTWSARLLSLGTISLLLIFLADDPPNPSRLKPHEWVGLSFFPFGMALGSAIGWFREGLGGAIVAASLLGFYGLSLLGPKGEFPGLIFAVFALPGLLFMLHWLLCARNQLSSGG